MNNLIIALTLLDPADDEHWTHGGQVRVDKVSEILQERGFEPVNRQNIIDAAPTFMRETAKSLIAGWKGEVDPTSITASCEPEKPETNGSPKLIEGQKACDLPLETLMNSWELLEAATAELDERSQELLKKRKEIEEELKVVYLRSELCAKRLAVLKPAVNPQDTIRKYQEGQRNANAERVRRRRSILDGIGAKGFEEETRVGSRLDTAMSARKPAPGSTRPAMGMPVKR